MKNLANIRDIENVQKLDNEYDLQKALLLDRKLRLMVKEDYSLKAIHDKLVNLIQVFESENWSDSETITDEQVEDSEIARKLVEIERKFILRRKEVIRKRLNSYDMTQQDLGVLLGHKKSYISELINGVSQFSLKDLVIIHRVLRIELSKLIPTYLQNETREKVRYSIVQLNKPKLKLRRKDLIMS
ncbi:MAG: transcriptional regulator [Bacteroidetes bacterium]|nr:MAG: transcriptional regulator [Bacteroidota bacterium]